MVLALNATPPPAVDSAGWGALAVYDIRACTSHFATNGWQGGQGPAMLLRLVLSGHAWDEEGALARDSTDGGRHTHSEMSFMCSAWLPLHNTLPSHCGPSPVNKDWY